MQSRCGKLVESHSSGGIPCEYGFHLNLEINGSQTYMFWSAFVSSRYINLHAGPCKTKVSVSIALKTQNSNTLKKLSDVRNLRDESRFANFPRILSRTPHLRCFSATAKLGTMSIHFAQR